MQEEEQQKNNYKISTVEERLLQKNKKNVKKGKNHKKKKVGTIGRFFIKTGALVGIIVFALTQLIVIYRMDGNTMSPFVRDGDLVIFYRLENIYLNDVVVYEDANGKYHVGRVVAGNRQTVNFPESGGYQVNGYLPSEEITYETYKAEKSKVKYPIKLGSDEYFILNDFRKLTTDSREMGAIKKEQIKGKLLFLMRRRNF